jgi:hypothetical protein
LRLAVGGLLLEERNERFDRIECSWAALKWKGLSGTDVRQKIPRQ